MYTGEKQNENEQYNIGGAAFLDYGEDDLVGNDNNPKLDDGTELASQEKEEEHIYTIDDLIAENRRLQGYSPENQNGGNGNPQKNEQVDPSSLAIPMDVQSPPSKKEKKKVSEENTEDKNLHSRYAKKATNYKNDKKNPKSFESLMANYRDLDKKGGKNDFGLYKRNMGDLTDCIINNIMDKLRIPEAFQKDYADFAESLIEDLMTDYAALRQIKAQDGWWKTSRSFLNLLNEFKTFLFYLSSGDLKPSTACKFADQVSSKANAYLQYADKKTEKGTRKRKKAVCESILEDMEEYKTFIRNSETITDAISYDCKATKATLLNQQLASLQMDGTVKNKGRKMYKEAVDKYGDNYCNNYEGKDGYERYLKKSETLSNDVEIAKNNLNSLYNIQMGTKEEGWSDADEEKLDQDILTAQSKVAAKENISKGLEKEKDTMADTPFLEKHKNVFKAIQTMLLNSEVPKTWLYDSTYVKTGDSKEAQDKYENNILKCAKNYLLKTEDDTSWAEFLSTSKLAHDEIEDVGRFTNRFCQSKEEYYKDLNKVDWFSSIFDSCRKMAGKGEGNVKETFQYYKKVSAPLSEQSRNDEDPQLKKMSTTLIKQANDIADSKNQFFQLAFGTADYALESVRQEAVKAIKRWETSTMKANPP